MMLTVVAVLLKVKLGTGWEDVASVISDLLVSDMTLARACELEHVGSLDLLDLVWMRSFRDAMSSNFTLAKLLQTEIHYLRWHMSKALVEAVKRDDVCMVQWLLAHFSGCRISGDVVMEAAKAGHLGILQVLEADNTHGGIDWVQYSLQEAARNSHWDLVRWLLPRTGLTKEEIERSYDIVKPAIDKNNLKQVKWLVAQGFRVSSEYWSPFGHKWMWEDRLEIFRFFLDGEGRGRCSAGRVFEAALQEAAIQGDLTFMQSVVSIHVQMIDDPYMGFLWAAEYASENGNLPIVKWVVEYVSAYSNEDFQPSRAMYVAVETNKLNVVKWLYERFGNDARVQLFGEEEEDPEILPLLAVDVAASKGFLDIIQFLHNADAKSRKRQKRESGEAHIRRPQDIGWSTLTMDCAAENGHLDVVKWLHVHRHEGCTTNAMDYAAANGHLEVVKWLLRNCVESFEWSAMDNAARDDNLELLGWLHENISTGCSTRAMDSAAANGHLDVLKWLQKNRSEGCTTAAMEHAAQNGHLDVVKWLHDNRSEGCTTAAMDNAAINGNLKVLQWLHANRSEGCTANAITGVVKRHYCYRRVSLLRLVEWLINNRYSEIQDQIWVATFKVIKAGEFEIALLLHAKHPSGFDHEDLRQLRIDTERSIGITNPNMFAWLMENYPMLAD